MGQWQKHEKNEVGPLGVRARNPGIRFFSVFLVFFVPGRKNRFRANLPSGAGFGESGVFWGLGGSGARNLGFRGPRPGPGGGQIPGFPGPGRARAAGSAPDPGFRGIRGRAGRTLARPPAGSGDLGRRFPETGAGIRDLARPGAAGRGVCRARARTYRARRASRCVLREMMTT